IVAGEAAADLPVALKGLADRGAESVLAEGGPPVSAQLAAAGLLDEVCLTLAPLVVAGKAGRILNGDQLPRPLRLEFRHVLCSEGYLFLHYGRCL
ncbi:MAG: dihydrofolate reductase family protein, partial [Acidimicrobiales bacterium]